MDTLLQPWLGRFDNVADFVQLRIGEGRLENVSIEGAHLHVRSDGLQVSEEYPFRLWTLTRREDAVTPSNGVILAANVTVIQPGTLSPSSGTTQRTNLRVPGFDGDALGEWRLCIDDTEAAVSSGVLERWSVHND